MGKKKNFVLFESAFGFAVFQIKDIDELTSTQANMTNFGRFAERCTMRSYLAIVDQTQSMETIDSVGHGEIPKSVREWLQTCLPKPKKEGKRPKFVLHVCDNQLASSVRDTLNFRCRSDVTTAHLTRAIREYFPQYLGQSKTLKGLDLRKLQLGLSHCFSRKKIQFNKKREDNMIIQSIGILDQLDKDINTCCMRTKEWFGWYFPELVRIATDQIMYCRIAVFIGEKSAEGSCEDGRLTEDHLRELEEICGSEELAKRVFNAMQSTIGAIFNIPAMDLCTVCNFARRVVHQSEYRAKLRVYLEMKMGELAPNLTALIGARIGARLIAKAGNLWNLSKQPASTVQILGAEKSLFRALKKGTNTPKYGLIFHSKFIQQAAKKDKGRISRFLANKAALAVRIDCFSKKPTNIYGTKLREQVEERMEFLISGKVPRKNMVVMKAAKRAIKKLNKKRRAEKRKRKGIKVKKEPKEEGMSERKRKRSRSKSSRGEKKRKKSRSSSRHKSSRATQI